MRDVPGNGFTVCDCFSLPGHAPPTKREAPLDALPGAHGNR